METTLPPFREWLANTMSALGYRSDSAFARALGISQSTVTRWRRNESPTVPDLDAVARISRVTGTPYEHLLVMVGHVPSSAVVALNGPPVALPGPLAAIHDANLSREQVAILERYWEARLAAEHKIITRLIRAAGDAGFEMPASDAAGDALRAAFELADVAGIG